MKLPRFTPLLIPLVFLFSPGFISAQSFEPHYTGPYEEVPGKFFLRVYVIYVQETNGLNGEDEWADNLGATELQRRTARTFEVLNSAYNPHGIYFVPAEGQAEGCYDIEDVTDPDIPSLYTDGITILVYSDYPQDLPHATGGVVPATAKLPALSFYVRGSEAGIPGSHLPVVIHEMGHSMGLAHTFAFTNLIDDVEVYEGPEESCVDGICKVSPLNDFDYCCGDMIDDTPIYYSGGAQVELTTECCCADSPFDEVALELLTNYMTYSYPSRCRNHFTPEQVRRMRKYLAYSTDLAEALLEPETIASNTTWNTAQTSAVNIEVEDGATLTIDEDLTMMPGTYVVVHRGGTLVVNATITGDCGGMWGGVVVEGDDAVAQTSPNQGRVFLNSDGTIEHALCGIGVYGFADANDEDFGGGVIEVRGDIRNCLTGIKFGRHRDGGARNRSFLSQATLSIDDDYRGVDNPQKPVFLYLEEINNLRVNYSVFNEDRTDDYVGKDLRADGLVAEDAGFRAYNCYFYNLDHGIVAHPLDNSGGYGVYEVRNSSFFNCFTAIDSSLPDDFTITGNEFKVGRPPECPLAESSGVLQGILISGYNLSDDIILEDNDFYAGNGDMEEEIFIGTACFGTGAMENFIRLNKYEELTYGNYAGSFNGGPTGLRYECNENTDNLSVDFYVEANGSVRSIQGDVDDQNFSTATGNEFTNEDAFAWYNDGNLITYYYENTPEQNPADRVAGTPGIDENHQIVASQANPNCGTSYEGCPPPCPGITVESWEDDFYQERADWFDKQDLYKILTDPEDLENTAREIVAHRSAMDLTAGRIIRHYALDSTGVKADSVLAWQERLYTFEADLRLARHYFLQLDFAAYDGWVTDISVRHTLDGRQTTELGKLTDMFDMMRPALEDDELPLNRLRTTVLDSLETWAVDCNEPGFIAREILRRNGRNSIPDCGPNLGARPIAGNSTRLPVSPDSFQGIRIYPNPAHDRLFFELPSQVNADWFTLTASDGRTVFRQTLLSSGQANVAMLPAGLYLCRIMGPNGLAHYQKVFIAHE